MSRHVGYNANPFVSIIINVFVGRGVLIESPGPT